MNGSSTIKAEVVTSHMDKKQVNAMKLPSPNKGCCTVSMPAFVKRFISDSGSLLACNAFS